MFDRLIYRLYRIVSTAKHHILRRYTRAGLIVLATLGASAVLGLDTNLSLIYQIFTFVLALLLLAWTYVCFFKGSFKVRRLLPRVCTAGESFEYRISVQNKTGRTYIGLTLIEESQDPRPDFEEFRGRWIQTGLRRWRQKWNRLGNAPSARMWNQDEQILPDLPGGGTIELKAQGTALRRGYLRFKGASIARKDPLSLVRGFAFSEQPQSLLVLPRRYPVVTLELPGAKRYQPGGVPLARSVGQSDEFVSLRDYRPGDPQRHIHWKSWARTNRPIVKEFEDEFFMRQALVLDTFCGWQSEELFEEAVSVGASFAWSTRTQESLLDLMFVGTEAYCFTAGRGVAPFEKLLEIMACVQPCREGSFESLHKLVIEHATLISGCVCVFIQWDTGRSRLVRSLRAMGIPVLALVVTSPDSPRIGMEKNAGAGIRVHQLRMGSIGEDLASL